MFSLTKNKIEIATHKDVEECLDEIKKVTNFYARGKKYSITVVTFVAGGGKKYSSVPLKSEQ